MRRYHKVGRLAVQMNPIYDLGESQQRSATSRSWNEHPLSSELVVSFFFFFSSRRRHTRSDRDWSSDVCSSDLLRQGARLAIDPATPLRAGDRLRAGGRAELLVSLSTGSRLGLRDAGDLELVAGSEERRVGKEGRSRWAPDH